MNYKWGNWIPACTGMTETRELEQILRMVQYDRNIGQRK